MSSAPPSPTWNHSSAPARPVSPFSEASHASDRTSGSSTHNSALSDISALSDGEDFELIHAHLDSNDSDAGSEASSNYSDNGEHLQPPPLDRSRRSSSNLALSFPDPESLQKDADVLIPSSRDRKRFPSRSSSPEAVNHYVSPSDSTISEAPTLVSASRLCDKEVQTIPTAASDETPDYQISDTVLWEPTDVPPLTPSKDRALKGPSNATLDQFKDSSVGQQTISGVQTVGKAAERDLRHVHAPVYCRSSSWSSKSAIRSAAVVICVAAATAGISYSGIVNHTWSNGLFSAPNSSASTPCSSTSVELGHVMPNTWTQFLVGERSPRFAPDARHSQASISSLPALTPTSAHRMSKRETSQKLLPSAYQAALVPATTTPASHMPFTNRFNSLITRETSQSLLASPQPRIHSKLQHATRFEHPLLPEHSVAKLSNMSAIGNSSSLLAIWGPAMDSVSEAFKASAGLLVLRAKKSVSPVKDHAKLRLRELRMNTASTFPCFALDCLRPQMKGILRQSRSGLIKVQHSLSQKIKVYGQSIGSQEGVVRLWQRRDFNSWARRLCDRLGQKERYIYESNFRGLQQLLRSERALQKQAWDLFGDSRSPRTSRAKSDGRSRNNHSCYWRLPQSRYFKKPEQHKFRNFRGRLWQGTQKLFQIRPDDKRPLGRSVRAE